jgi:flagellar biosynthetic protein FliP
MSWIRVRHFLMLLAIAVLWMSPANAQDIGITLGDDSSLASRSIQILVLITVLSLVPGIAIMVTCFPFFVTVFAILRQAIGLQQSPPNMMMVSLALFMTYFVMEPVFLASWETGISPVVDGTMDIETGFFLAMEPLHIFMAGRIDPDTFERLVALRPDVDPMTPIDQANLSVVIPSFMLSELARAFQVGFIVFLPFLIIDLIVAAVLMSMGMMMVPPAIVSLPFKLSFFVVADGWSLLSTGLVQSYAT